MNRAFADTFYFLALLNRDDATHARAMAATRSHAEIVTTDFILLEPGNACARAADHADFIALVDGIRMSPRFRIVPLSGRLLEAGLKLMQDRSDKDWSLTDCISFRVMEEEALVAALTGDRHYEQAGFQALLKPSER